MRRGCLALRIAPFFVGALILALGACTDDAVHPLASADAAGVSAARSGTDPTSKVNRLPPELEQRVQALRADLEREGYEVARGYWSLWGAEDCKYPLRTVGFCYGNNPTAPYAMAVLPRWKDEFVDQSLHHAILAAQRNMAPNYRLDEREALVIVGELPPPGRYFGIQSNVFTREATLDPNDQIYQRVTDPLLRSIFFAPSPNPSRMMIVASIGNSTNNVVIEQQSGTAFGQNRYFIITSDQGMEEAMTAALLRAGVPTVDHVFTEPVAPALVRVGLGSAADDLITYIRYAIPENEVLGQQWRERLPLAILRVRNPAETGPLNPYPVPSYEARTASYDETSTLGGDLQALVAAVRARWSQQGAVTIPFFSASIFLDLVGQHCLGYPPGSDRGPMNCLGDGQDADYQIGPSLRIDDGQVIAVVGTLATQTGNATYVSLAVNRFPALVGVQNLSDADLEGTAAPFASVLLNEHRLFYVHYLARDCAGLNPCLEIPRKRVPTGERISLMQRNYVNPGTRRGPDPTKLLNPVAIVLDGSVRPGAD